MATIWVDQHEVGREHPLPVKVDWFDEANEIAPVKEKPVFDIDYTPLNATSAAPEASRIVKASAGILYGLTVYSNGVAQWIQIHDAATVPADAAVPTLVFEISADTTRSIDFGRYGRRFTNGIVVCNSTTDTTKTIGAANCLFDAQYI